MEKEEGEVMDVECDALVECANELSLEAGQPMTVRQLTGSMDGLSLVKGWATLRAINAATVSPTLGVTLSATQFAMVHLLVDTNLPAIFGDTWPNHRHQVLEERRAHCLKFGRICPANMKPRTGRSIAVACFYAIMLVCMPRFVTHAVYDHQNQIRHRLQAVKHFVDRLMSSDTECICGANMMSVELLGPGGDLSDLRGIHGCTTNLAHMLPVSAFTRMTM